MYNNVFTHNGQSIAWASPNIVPANLLFYSLYYAMLSLTSLKITQVFHLLLGFAENQTVFWDFKTRNSFWITEGSDNGDSGNWGLTVCIYVCVCIYM